MNYPVLLDFATDLAYRLAMNGAETFRVEDTVTRIMDAYGISSEVFAIPNCLHVSIETSDGQPMTRMRRIGHHGNDLDSVERYSNLSRRVCAEKPTPETAMQWLKDTDLSRVHYSLPVILLGNFLGSCGFAILFGGSWKDSICAGFCGILVGISGTWMDKWKANLFFKTIFSSFLMAVPAYFMAYLGIADNADATIIGTLMLLVPGLLFTNAMRDIIYGDTNSGINRIVQVFLIAAAIALGTAAAWNVSVGDWGAPMNAQTIEYGFLPQMIACFVGCIGFSILFNIHGPGGLLCALGGSISWATYLLVLHSGNDDITAYFWATIVSAVYAEVMARARKYPAISYLVVSIFPMIPGAGVYYTMTQAVMGNMSAFVDQGMHTIAIAGVMAVGILLVSTSVRIWNIWKPQKMRQ